MKYLLILGFIALLFSSCLKQSIADAMIHKNDGPTASISFKVNGTTVSMVYPKADLQTKDNYSIACIKEPGFRYTIDTEYFPDHFRCNLVTDSLTKGTYRSNVMGTAFLESIRYSGGDLMPYYLTDSVIVHVTSYSNGHVSGDFEGTFTPFVYNGTSIALGTPSSAHVTEGIFKNIPVLY